jgi:hypothetical protein
LEFLFVAVSNAEICRKIAPYATNQEMFDIKTFTSSSSACAAVKRQYGREFSVRVAPSGETLSGGLVEDSEETGCVCVCVCAS